MKHLYNLAYLSIIFACGYVVGKHQFYKENDIEPPKRKKKPLQIRFGGVTLKIGDEV